MSGLTPREAEVCARLTSEAERRGMTVGELAAVVICRLEGDASCGMARIAVDENPRPLIRQFNE